MIQLVVETLVCDTASCRDTGVIQLVVETLV